MIGFIPVVFIIFNRPETTAKVFEAIRAAKPHQLFVVADGAREKKLGEKLLCSKTRAIVENIDWDCDVKYNYSDKNMGCALRITSGLNWVFEQVEAAIILEDDCLPDPTFFLFCTELLERYKMDTRVFSISGSYLPWFKKRTEESYFYSAIPHIWGWATWRRAWKMYDIKLLSLPKIVKGNWLQDCTMVNRRLLSKYTKAFQNLFKSSSNPYTWDYQLGFCCQTQGCHSIVPNVNMVSNIGFGIGESHSQAGKNIFSDNPTESMPFPLKHPEYMINDIKYDHTHLQFLFQPKFRDRVKSFCSNPIGSILKKMDRDSA